MEWQNPGCTEEECYRRLRDAIIDGTLMPSQRLVEAEVAQWLGASRATVRTVLARLEQEGLVERERYSGAHVRHVSHEEAIEILEVRIALECLIVRYASTRANDEDLTELQQIFASMRANYEEFDLLSYSEGNAKLHSTIAKMSGHETACRLLEMLNSQNVRYQYRTIFAPNRSSASIEEHQAIVEAICDRDPDRAEQMMRIHLSHVCDAMRQYRKCYNGKYQAIHT